MAVCQREYKRVWMRRWRAARREVPAEPDAAQRAQLACIAADIAGCLVDGLSPEQAVERGVEPWWRVR